MHLVESFSISKVIVKARVSYNFFFFLLSSRFYFQFSYYRDFVLQASFACLVSYLSVWPVPKNGKLLHSQNRELLSSPNKSIQLQAFFLQFLIKLESYSHGPYCLIPSKNSGIHISFSIDFEIKLASIRNAQLRFSMSRSKFSLFFKTIRNEQRLPWLFERQFQHSYKKPAHNSFLEMIAALACHENQPSWEPLISCFSSIRCIFAAKSVLSASSHNHHDLL